MTKVIDYQQILANTKTIINALEFDCMRSGGKVKFNATTLNELHKLEEHYQRKVNEIQARKKPGPKPKPKEEG